MCATIGRDARLQQLGGKFTAEEVQDLEGQLKRAVTTEVSAAEVLVLNGLRLRVRVPRPLGTPLEDLITGARSPLAYRHSQCILLLHISATEVYSSYSSAVPSPSLPSPSPPSCDLSHRMLPGCIDGVADEERSAENDSASSRKPPSKERSSRGAAKKDEGQAQQPGLLGELSRDQTTTLALAVSVLLLWSLLGLSSDPMAEAPQWLEEMGQASK